MDQKYIGLGFRVEGLGFRIRKILVAHPPIQPDDGHSVVRVLIEGVDVWVPNEGSEAV